MRQKTFKVGTFQSSSNGMRWQPEGTFTLGENSDIVSLYGATWASDGESLVGSNSYTPGIYFFSTLEKTLKLRKVRMPSSFRKSVVDDDVRVSSVACSPTPSMVAMGTSGGEIWLWNLQENSLPVGEPLTSNSIGARKVQALSWSPDGKWLAASYADVNASILIWKVRG
ncbi:WD40 repeat domain-containing protein [Ktedonospora formicarum]|uniref:Anaphase-promoting complex subunit 4-like WD40 domain-containing protein n=1 Tax=Ktedonospora formicarum TaxID=2778364 RepID=A0A8J3I6S8_9CHLR|nr:WD40 repeat domain-containing protein [Ktedonospora formicarum]GHO46489.1 hypothetical protein KSX_46520 [Ktedonospora formicarum]